MTAHWAYVAIAWGLSGVVFAVLTAMAVTRYRMAKRQLAQLETRR
jgi:heme exporter protein CcmD